MYYRSVNTNKILSEGSAKIVSDIYGAGALGGLVSSGILVPIENPSVIECIKYGCGLVAVYRYRELHPDCSMKNAHKAIREIRKDINKANLRETKDTEEPA